MNVSRVLLLSAAILAVSPAFSQLGDETTIARPPPPPPRLNLDALPSDSGDRKPEVRVQVPPQYPAELKQRRIEGSATVEITVDEQGSVSNARALAATEPAFGEAAVAAVRKWKFTPGLRHGIPVACRFSLPIGFKLDPKEQTVSAATSPNGNTASEPSKLPPRTSDPNRPDQLPIIRRQVPPQYPPEMKSRGVEGSALVRFTIDEKGNVRDCVAIRSTSPEFEQPAIDAVRQWRFTPAKKDGKAVSCQMTFPIGFRLGDGT